MSEDTEYNYGLPIDTDTLKEDKWEQCAKEWGEEDKYLTDLLLFCLKNGIKTRACCSGHNGEKSPYLAFEMKEKNNPIIDAISNEYKDKKGCNLVYFSEDGESIQSFAGVFFEKGENTKVFERIQEICKQIINGKNLECSDLHQKARKFMYLIKKPDTQQYIAFENAGKEQEDAIQINAGDRTYKLVEILHGKEDAFGKFMCKRTKDTEKLTSKYINNELKKLEYKVNAADLRVIAARPKSISVSTVFQKIARYISRDENEASIEQNMQKGD